jgi:molybdopterin converting factor small subunit
MAAITVRLFASLRKYTPGDSLGVIDMNVKEDLEIREIVSKLNIPEERVKMIMKNGRVAAFGDTVKEGDRIAFFPPEVAFNLYIALNFREDLR